jgi:hypothetical protein
MKPPVRVPSQISESLHRRLNAYALAASAAGVGVLALAQRAEARIVYTPKHVDCTYRCYVNLTGHQKEPFQLYSFHDNSGTSARWSALMVYGRHSATSLGIVAYHAQRRRYAAALRAGVSVGPDKHMNVGPLIMWSNFLDILGTYYYGAWANGGKGVKNRYLGLVFNLGKAPHYGWARLTTVHSYGRRAFHTTLTGYAYETIPNKPIIAGKTKGPDVVTVQPTTLGHLAAGASAIPAWRKAGANK